MFSTLFIARRYLFSVRSHSIVNIISGVSLFSLLTPIAAIILLLSIFNGFGIMVRDMDASVEAELIIKPSEGQFFEERDLPKEDILAIEGVLAASYMLEQLMLIEREGESKLFTVRGVDESYEEIVPFRKAVALGEFPPKDKKIILSSSASMALGLRSIVRDSLNLFAIKNGGLQGLMPTGAYVSEKVAFAGIYYLDSEHEEKYIYASRNLVEQLLRRDNVASRLILKIDEGVDKQKLKKQIEELLGDRFKVISREEINPMVYQILRYEKLGIVLISFLVMILASFSLMGALSMLIVEREKDVITLRSMGLSRAGVREIFIQQGILIAGFAIFCGSILGIGLTLLQKHFGIVTLPQNSFFQNAYPVDLQWLDVITVLIMSISIAYVLCRIVVGVLMRNLK